MNLEKSHIIFKVLTVILVITILTPSLVKFGHVFENHQHDFCVDNLEQTHLHSLDIDCEFYKFKINNPFTINTIAYDLVSIENNHKVYTSQYQFISDFQRLPFALRGPPRLV
ncbi:hypothetical protein [Oceanihabitans sediminis]|uniref:Transmembrane protein n=1 Tax=Oceanihabitans sediminis TaxID=1812012 RepID=A0A368P8A7_9FLAO|nr:hypothetical protein [Oceanihabitans sediminis]MDX1277161.1 hypothetical protein [Oceanihabitans sediminis]MDX1773579.1 hypothetical protein [Oceanihabitans sediminis]RBP33023.1 hypothetical protein DFR65_102359 [Oceanihabitans sediminis]RCU57461.1 hypothetical protein DU428_06610 [Oceanihabitans sediminis]